jgi:hypothetical protein
MIRECVSQNTSSPLSGLIVHHVEVEQGTVRPATDWLRELMPNAAREQWPIIQRPPGARGLA